MRHSALRPLHAKVGQQLVDRAGSVATVTSGTGNHGLSSKRLLSWIVVLGFGHFVCGRAPEFASSLARLLACLLAGWLACLRIPPSIQGSSSDIACGGKISSSSCSNPSPSLSPVTHRSRSRSRSRSRNQAQSNTLLRTFQSCAHMLEPRSLQSQQLFLTALRGDRVELLQKIVCAAALAVSVH